MAAKKTTPAVHKAGQEFRKGNRVAALAESERAQIRELKAENADLRKENTTLRRELRAAKSAPPKAKK